MMHRLKSAGIEAHFQLVSAFSHAAGRHPVLLIEEDVSFGL